MDAPRFPAGGGSQRETTASAILLACAGAAFVLWRGWLCDDAFITFRHVINLWGGSGPVFNPGERVQGFTHPLWFGVLVAGSVFAWPGAVAVAAGLACTVALLVVLYRLSVRTGPAVFLLVSLVLLSSRSFIEYQTSGLENSLTNLLLALLWLWLPGQGVRSNLQPITTGAVLCALLLLNRPDHVVLCLPFLILLGWMARRSGWRGWLSLLLGLLPWLAWLFFATLYYGSPLPNSVYAKLALPMPVGERLHAGLLYLWTYLAHEPLHAVFCGAVLGAGVHRLARTSRLRRPGLGVLTCRVAAPVLQLAGVVFAGGDFMHGRLMVSVLVLCVLLAGEVLPVQSLTRGSGRMKWAVPFAIGAGAILYRTGGFGASDLLRGVSDLQEQLLLHPAVVLTAAVLLVGATGLILRQLRDRERHAPALLFTGALIVSLVLVIGAMGGSDPQPQETLLLLASLVGCSWLLGIAASRSLPGAGVACATLTLLAGVFSLCDFRHRTPILGIGNITDQWAYTSGPWWSNRFHEPSFHMHSQARLWASEGRMARRYADQVGPFAVSYRALGLFSYHAGPAVHVIDLHGLTDAFVARCPAEHDSQIGHVKFRIPREYLMWRGVVDLLPDWKSRIAGLDPSLGAQAFALSVAAITPGPAPWQVTHTVVTAPLFDAGRLRALPAFICAKQ